MKLTRILFGKFTLKRLMISILEIYFAIGIFAWFFADKMAHHPPQKSDQTLPGEIKVNTADGIQLSALWLPKHHATHTILFSHGNAENLDHDLFLIREYWNIGFNVFAYDYRGYGRSAGKPSENGLCLDIEAAYNHLVDSLKITPASMIVLGRSMGSGPSTYLATIKPVGGLILESSFTSLFRVPIPFPLFPFDQFPNLKRLSKVSCPLLVIHGDRDGIIAFRHGEKLYKAYRGPKEFLRIEGAGHNDVFAVAPDLYLNAIKEFREKKCVRKDGEFSFFSKVLMNECK